MYKPGDKVQFNLLPDNHKFEKTIILLVEKVVSTLLIIQKLAFY